MIKVEDISKGYGKQELFKELSFTIAPGEKIGLVGRNGYGKTTLFQILTGQVEADLGNVSFPRDYRVGYLEQQIRFSQETVLKEGCLGLRDDNAQLNGWRVEKILAGLGFDKEDLQKNPYALSAGFQIRLNLAKVLVSEPDLLLLDEPNNYLDIVSIRWLIQFLRNWKKEMLLITHDRLFMDEVTTHTMIIHRQQARKVKGGTQKIYQQIALEEEVHEKTRLNVEKKRKQTEVFISRFRAKARLGGLVQSRVKMLEKQEQLKKLVKIESLDFSFRHKDFPAGQMMSAHNLRFSYTGGDPWLIDQLSFNIGRKERICVIGRNGKGKSTLLRILAGELLQQSGTIKKHPLLEAAFFGQSTFSQLNEQRTVFEEIMSADIDSSPQQARTLCGAMMFSGDLALKPVSVLSGGEKSRVLLGKFLATPCHLLLLDEPTNHLDMESCEALMEAIEEFPGSVIMVTHNELYLHRLATKLIVFDRGMVKVFDGKYQDFLDKVGWESEEDGTDDSGIKKQKPEDERRMLKREKAELLQERARVLKPIELEINRIEKLITALEKELHECTEALIQASTNGDAAAIAKMSKESHRLRPEIEKHYNELDRTLAHFEQKSSEYKKKMIEMGENRE